MNVGQALMVACAALGFLAGTARAEDLHVPSNAYRSIKRAVAKARPGDRILVRPGVYEEADIVLRRRGVTIRGDQAVWRGRGARSRALTIRRRDCEVSGFTFEGVSVHARGARVVVRDNTFTGTSRKEVLRVKGNDAQILRNTLVDIALDDRVPHMVKIIGDGALVEANQIHNAGTDERTSNHGVSIRGARAVVRGNLVTGGLDYNDIGLSVEGGQARFLDNVVRPTHGYGIRAIGLACVVDGNQLELIEVSPAVAVYGGSSRIEGNSATSKYEGEGALPLLIGIGNVGRFASNSVSTRSSPAATLIGDGFEVEDNGVHGSGVGVGEIVRIEGDFAIVERNLIDGLGPVGTGMYVEGLGVRFVDNIITGTPASESATDAVELRSDACLVQGNSVKNVSRGLWVVGKQNSILDNTARSTGDIGISVLGSDNEVFDCSAHASRINGIRVNGHGNVLRRCLSQDGHGDPSPQAGIGIYVRGNDNVIEDSTSTGSESRGIFLSGDRNRLLRGIVSSNGIGLHIGGTDNSATDSSIVGAGREGLRIFGNSNVLTDCDIDGLTLGAYVEGDGNTLTDCAVQGGSEDGATILGDANLFARCPLGGGRRGVLIDGSRNRLSDCTLLGETAAGMELLDGQLNVIERCTTTGANPGFLIRNLAFDTLLTSCESRAATSDGLRHEGQRTSVRECVFQGSTDLDVRNTGTFTLVEDNVFDTGGF